MTDGRKEIIFGLTFVTVYLVLFHFLRSFAMFFRDVVGWTSILGPIILNVAGWWRWRGTWRNEKTARWRKTVGLLGLAANTLVACVVWLSFLYGVFVVDVPHSNGFRGIDLYPVIVACLMLSVATLAIGMIAPSRIRLAVVLGGFAMGWMILSVLGHRGIL